MKKYLALMALIATQNLSGGDEPFESKAISGLAPAAEAYFSPDSQSLIFNAKFNSDETYFVYTARTDGSDVRKINGWGADGCSFYFPAGDKIIWTSTRDFPSWPGDYSDPDNYPQGSELYVSDLQGNNVQRMTNNTYYDAEVSVSPDGKHILFTRQMDGMLDLWIMNSDGTDERQLTFTPEWQEGGSFFMPDNDTIIFRAWKRSDQGRGGGLPMTLFTINKEGKSLTQLTSDPGTNWAPYPAPDGKHVAFVKLLPGHNYEIFLRNIETGEELQLTNSPSFDGFPAISPDGKWLAYSSSRNSPAGSHSLGLFLMDISSLNLGSATSKK